MLGQDSSFYVGAARELAHGRGLVVPDRAGGFVPLIHYPPLLPFLLSLGRWSKVDPWTVDRWLNSVLFSANILLTGLTVKRFSPSAWLPVTAALLAITSVGMLKLHSIADSEPIFVCCCLLGINGFCAYLQMNQRTPLVLASIAVALGCLDRYAGLSMIPVGLILTFSHRAKPMRGRLDDAIIFTMISAAPISAWITRNAVLYHNATNRTMQWHPPDAQAFAGAFATFVDWFVPSSYSQFTKTAVGGSALLVLLIVMSTWLTRNYHRSDRPGGPSANGGALRSVLIVTLCCYCGFVLIARTLFDGGINFDERILLPVFILGAMLFLIVADDVMKNRGRIAIVTRSWFRRGDARSGCELPTRKALAITTCRLGGARRRSSGSLPRGCKYRYFPTIRRAFTSGREGRSTRSQPPATHLAAGFAISMNWPRSSPNPMGFWSIFITR